MVKWRGRLYATDRARDFDHERDHNVRARQIYETIDRQPFQYLLTFVAGIGFFLDGYTLFAANIALPMIAYVYWQNETSSYKTACVNIATLSGTLAGQLLFGYLGDRYGRRKMYGVELLMLISSTLGVVMCSTGAHNSMSVFAWLIWWRFVVGIGVGADYPLSAVITSEFAPTKHRARMMATVFFKQPLGQIAGNLVAMVVVSISRRGVHEDLIRDVDIMWRWVVGLGVIPGILALAFRLAIPETPRFLLDIDADPVKAEFDATQLFGEPSLDSELESRVWSESMPCSSDSNHAFTDASPTIYKLNSAQMPTLNSTWALSRADIHQYFWVEGNWRTLFATSMTWLLLDFGFYGIGISNPHFLAKTWGTLRITGPAPSWMTDEDPNRDVYSMFMNTALYALVILNIGSLAGGLMMILMANRLNRVSLQKYGFLALAAVFIALGVEFIVIHKEGALAISLYVAGQFFFNFGPNSTTYIIPAELFPTRYRATCHGISAAAGKLGSILVQVFSTYYRFGSSTPGDDGTRRYGVILVIFSGCMFAGAIVTHFWIPEVQENSKRGQLFAGKAKTLEELALGRRGVESHSMVRSRRTRSFDGL